MIILIKKSCLFTEDPDKRFSNAYKVDRGLWKEMWRRHSIMEYTKKDLADYFKIKTGQTISNQSLKRWINRTRIYMRAKPVLDMGCESVNSNFFEDLEWFVIKEALKNIKSSVKKEPKILP